MSKYKVVPVELTKEMLDSDPYGMGYGRIHAVYHRLLSASPETGMVAVPRELLEMAAPAVQGEPVVNRSYWHGMIDRYLRNNMDDDQYEEYSDALERATAPQPAGQQPAPDVAAPAAKFNLGDTVRKTKGSQWKGRVVGTYSTDLTPEGYAVESDTEKGSVQICPAGALELVVGHRKGGE